MEEQIFEQRTDLSALNDAVNSIRNEIKKIIVGQDEMVKLIITALLADGHVLIEGVPGVAKTLTAKLVAKSVNVGFSQNTVYTGSYAFRCIGNTSVQSKGSKF